MTGAFDNMTREETAHTARAVAAHAIWARDNGIPMPATLLQRVRAARSGQSSHSAPKFAHGDLAMLTTAQTAEVLEVSERTVRRLIASGELPSVVVGRSRRVTQAALQEYISALPGSFRDHVHLKQAAAPVTPAHARLAGAAAELRSA